MKLEAYLAETRQSIESFAQEAGISAQAIYKYLRGERIPRKEFLTRLAKITGGEVTANDFLDLPGKEEKPMSKAQIHPLPAAKAALSRQAMLSLYRDMLLIRRFEEKAGQLYGMGLIGGFCHLYIGQEAVVVGMQSCISAKDSVITSYRDHGHMIACGMDPKGIMAELTGREGGFSHGKGGSMHMFSTEKHFYGGHGIVGASVPIGTGIGFAHKYREDGALCLAYFGDGASNQGQVYESFNMASLWKLPVIYIIENNQYAMGTSLARASATTELYKRGEGFGIPGRQVDGMDVMAVRAAGMEAVKYVKGGNGPFLLEMKTYRYRGHSMSDPAKYRSKEEVEEYKSHHDPIEGLKGRLVAGGVATEDALKKIDQEIKAVIAEAAEFAQQSPEPAESELWTDVTV
ncbi:MAG: pyruvate dehydrogenase (acetyl-transferring) E1 component subunit alpha [Pseudomonadota bacterium]|nr:pyruvate dehydrogenase (acetyl-transferring) E1 component subunit alpha [Pseudomonadota bacterium]MDE3037199.1 pyruvate dehydrogenase (acetyl-transferring) E1 component subunit alpha [Pseudomonadota bacterium]